MQCTSSGADLSVKISEIFKWQNNYEKPNTQTLLGYESICTEQTMKVKVLGILLNFPTHIWSRLLNFQVLLSSTQSMKNKKNYTNTIQNLFLQRVILSL